MNIQPISLQVSETIGTVSAEYILPETSKCMLTLAHGAGAGMNHAFMVALAHALAQRGIATLRFNFPFIENNKKRADVPGVAHKTIEAAIKHALENYADLPLFVSGKSFGGRMSSQYLALHPSSKIKGLIFYGFPLHPAGKPSVDRAAHLKEVEQPMLFLQGSRDALAEWNLIEQVCSVLPKATLIKIEGADHTFKAGKQDTISMLADYSNGWIEDIIRMPN